MKFVNSMLKTKTEFLTFLLLIVVNNISYKVICPSQLKKILMFFIDLVSEMSQPVNCGSGCQFSYWLQPLDIA